MKYPRFKLIIRTENGVEVYRYSTSRKGTILTRLTGSKNLGLDKNINYSYYIMVRYSPKFKNSGIYTNTKDAIYAYHCFTEKDLIDDFKS